MADRMQLPLSRGLAASICADDFERRLFCEFADGFTWEGRICDRNWTPQENPNADYARCIVKTSGGKLRDLRLHRLVLCARAGDIVDHIDGDGLNCVRHNLRFVTTAQNCHNRTGAISASSRFKGVSLHRRSGKWQSQIKSGDKQRYLGLFADEADAARAYDAAALDLFGGYAALNFPAV